MDFNPFLLINPYHHVTFCEFIFLFVQRLGALLTGNLSLHELATDEIQIFVLMGVAISSALVGCFLLLRRMTMLANSLSHTILIGIALAYFFTLSFSQHQDHHALIAPMEVMLIAALITGCLTVFITEFLTKTAKLQEDASTGLVFTTLFALGVILVTVLTRHAHIGTEAVMGNVDALHQGDMFWVYFMVGFNIILFILFFKEFKLTTFDPGLAKAMGISPFLFNYLLMAQVSTTSITSFRAVGVLLLLAFMTGPPLMARLLTQRLSSMLLCAVGFGVTSALIGVAVTRHILTFYGAALSTSGVVVCTILVLYFAVLSFHIIKNYQGESFIFKLFNKMKWKN